MNTPLVMTVIGPDRPGLVDSVASLVEEHGGNWLESRMCHLGGQFAGLLQVEIPESKRELLQASLMDLGAGTLEIVIHESGSDSDDKCAEVAIVEIVGQDRPGIVRHISHAFASKEVNVEELSTTRYSAPCRERRFSRPRPEFACRGRAIRIRCERSWSQSQPTFRSILATSLCPLESRFFPHQAL